MSGLMLAVLASIGWGTTGMLAGRASRSLPPLHVALALEWSGLVMIGLALVAVRPASGSAGDLGFALAAGVAGALGNVLVYAALSVGAMGLVAPIAAFGAAIPVIAFGVAGGDRPSGLAVVGMVAALAGGVTVARAPGRATRRGLGLAVAAALSYGLYFSLLDLAADGGALWATTTSRAMAAAFLAVLVFAVLRHRIRGAEGRGLVRVMPIGFLDALATLAFALATTRGLVSLVAVIACLYPITTAALAYALLGERLGRWQAIGAALAVAGVAMIVATA
jgi:drug/metabolite transporter (DMT)-like permease